MAQNQDVRSPEVVPAEVPSCLHTIGIRTWDEAAKVLTVTTFCFTANTILLLGRNIGATMLLTGLGADALPYVMVLVGVFIMAIMPIVACLVNRSSSATVLSGTTFLMIAILSTFTVLFVTGVADAYPRIVYSLFFVLEEVIDSLLMVLFWQSEPINQTRQVNSRWHPDSLLVCLVSRPQSACSASPKMKRRGSSESSIWVLRSPTWQMDSPLQSSFTSLIRLQSCRLRWFCCYCS